MQRIRNIVYNSSFDPFTENDCWEGSKLQEKGEEKEIEEICAMIYFRRWFMDILSKFKPWIMKLMKHIWNVLETTSILMNQSINQADPSRLPRRIKLEN